MFKAYEYFKEKEAGKTDGLPVYRVTGLSKMEELVRNARDAVFPCLVVDYGVDGILDLDDRTRDQGYYTIHLLDSTSETERIFPVLDAMFERGKMIMRQMSADRWAPGEPFGPCYGFKPATVRYSAIGPVGMLAYGYTFNYEMDRDHEI